MSHTENCVFCFNAVLDVDDGAKVLMDYKFNQGGYVCIECLNELEDKPLMKKGYFTK